MTSGKMKIGELAKQTGLTIRTLRYYEEVGLLVPSDRMESGYRLYGPEEIEQLHRILSLKQLGLSLDEIRTSLDDPDFSPGELIRKQLLQLKKEIKLKEQLHDQLEMLGEYIQRSEKISFDELIKTIRIMKTHEKYFTPGQREFIHERFKKVGKDHIHEVEQEWTELIAEVRVEMEKGTDPSDDAVQRLAQRWQSLLKEFTGGDPGIQKSLNTMYQNEDPENVSHGVVDHAVMDYIITAMKTGEE